MALLFIVFLVLGLTWSVTATPLPAASSGQWEVSGQKLSELKNLTIVAKSESSRIFYENCERISKPRQEVCRGLEEKAQGLQNLPRFVSNRSRSLEEQFEDMYKVCIGFSNLLEQFLNDVQQQGGNTELSSDLTKLRNVSLGSVKAKLMELKPNMASGVTFSADTSSDVTSRNLNNLQKIVARLAAEMNNMASAL